MSFALRGAFRGALNASRPLLHTNSSRTTAFAPARTALLSGSSSSHIDTPDNNKDTPWDFTAHNYERVNTILAKYPDNYKQSACMPLLDLAQRQNDNFLPLVRFLSSFVGSIRDPRSLCSPFRPP